MQSNAVPLKYSIDSNSPALLDYKTAGSDQTNSQAMPMGVNVHYREALN